MRSRSEVVKLRRVTMTPYYRELGSNTTPHSVGSEPGSPVQDVLMTVSETKCHRASPQGKTWLHQGRFGGIYSTFLLHTSMTRDVLLQAHNHFIVQQCRKTLLKAGFEQNPCLECEAQDVKQPFICA
jgi:hypothetical protein